MRVLPLLIATALLLPGCDAVSDLAGGALDAAGSASADGTAERPEGWESIEDEASAVRLYYQFVDEQRRVRFVERLEDVPEPLRASVGFVKMDVPPPLTPGDAARVRQTRLASRGSPATARDSRGGTEIVLYSAEWCGACRKAKRYLSRNGVDFEEKDVDNPHHAEELQRRTGARAIPVLAVEGRVVTGFSQSSYEAILKDV